MKIPILVLGIILSLGGVGLAIYGMRLPNQYSYQAIITDNTQTYTESFLQTGNSTSFSQSVSSGSWMEINMFSDEDIVEVNVTGSVSGQLYDITDDQIYYIVHFDSTETISVEIRNPSFSDTYISGTFTFEHWGIQSATRYQMEPLYLLFGGVILCSGIVAAIYGVRSK